MATKQEQFNDLLEKMLSNYQDNPDMSVDDVIENSLSELGVKEETKKKVREAGLIIDAIQRKSVELQKAKELGSRERWLAQEINRISEKTESPEEQKEILDSFADTLNKQFEQTIFTEGN